MDNEKKDATAGNRKLFVVRFYLIIALTFFMGVGPVAAYSESDKLIYVCPYFGVDYHSGTSPVDTAFGVGPKRTIAAAVDEVRQRRERDPGQWTIVLLEGTHVVPQAIRIHDGVYTIVGANWGKTIIDAGSKARIFHVSRSGGLKLKDLILRNGYQKKGDDADDGGAIFSDSIGELSIERCSFRDNKGRRGGAIFCSNTKVHITDSYFTGNWALQDGGAIWLKNTGAGSGSNNCFFRNNQAGSQVVRGAGGAVIVLDGGDFYHSKNKFRENKAAYGGAISLTGMANLQKMSDCEFEDNQAYYEGGAIFNNNGELQTMGCAFSRNTAGRHGGAICDGDGGSLRVDNCTFNHNLSWNLGGAVYNGSSAKILGSAFTGNQADEGGAIYNKGDFSIGTSTFTKNEARFVFGDAWGLSDEFDKSNHSGGALYNADKATATVSRCDFWLNMAGRGGALANDGGCRGVIEGSAFTRNRANQGGAVCNKGEITIESCTLTRNEACVIRDNLGLSDHSGGALYNAEEAKATVIECEFSANMAGRGGALANGGGGSTVVTESAFTDNTAHNGNVLYAQSAETEMYFNRIMGKGIEDIFCEDSVVYADRNWWGSNANPRERLRRNVFFDPWVVLSIKAENSHIHNGDASVITADLLHDSDGVYHDPAQGCIPAGPVTLAVPWGSFDNDYIIHSETRETVDGRVEATFHANEGSTPLPLDLIRVTAMMDGYETTDKESAYVTINRADPPM